MSCSDCIAHVADADELLERMFPGGRSPSPLPPQGTFEITLRCNVRCSHCYILYPGATDGELNTEQAKTVLKKIAEGGTLFLLLTGGETLARPDFPELYLYAKRLGLLVSVYSNATLVDQAIIDLWTQYPPQKVEVTIYGDTRETYERVTNVPGSFARFRAGVQRLLDAGINLQLKAMILQSNKHELEAMRDWALERTGQFKYDLDVGPRLDGDRGVLKERLSPREYVDLQLADPAYPTVYKEKMKKAAFSQPDEELFHCGYGIRTFHVDPAGKLHPCMLWRENPFDLLNQDLDEGWREYVHELRQQRNSTGGCNACSNRAACGRCPAASLLEMGDPTKPIPFFCQATAEKQRRLGKPPNLTIEII